MAGRVKLEFIKTLNAKQKTAAEMTANGVPFKKICEALGISSQTLAAWRQRCGAFRDEVLSLQRNSYEDTASRTFSLANASVSCLAKMIVAPETPAAVKAQCCGIALGHQMRLLDYRLRVAQHEALERRVAAIEERQSQSVDVEVRSLSSAA